MRTSGIVPWVAVMLAGCGSHGEESTATSATQISLSEAPAATQTFFWGTLAVSAPGFVGPPADMLTISVDGSGNLHYLSFKTLPMVTKVFGEGSDQYPLSGTKHVTTPDSGVGGYDVTVLDNPPPTSDHFLLRYHVVNSAFQYDYVESVEGTSASGGWAVAYSMTGTFDGPSIDAQASGTLYAGDPSAPAPQAGQATTWSAPVELTAPGFYGPPVDHLTVGTDSAGGLQSLRFDKFPILAHTFGTGADDFPLSGTATSDGRTIAVDLNTPPDPNHFALRYHVTNPANEDDYEEGVDGTNIGAGLVVRYFVQGSLEGASISAHAAGTLVPASGTP